MVKFVRGKIASVGITAGIILLAAWAAKKYNVGDQVVQSLRGTGQTVGMGITSPFEGILDGLKFGFGNIAESTGEFSKEMGNIGNNFWNAIDEIGESWNNDSEEKKSSNGNSINISPDMFGPDNTIGPNTNAPAMDLDTRVRQIVRNVDTIMPRPTATTGFKMPKALNLKNVFSDSATQNRIRKQIRLASSFDSKKTGSHSKPFGGFGSAQKQEVALRQAIEKSKAANAKWFS